MIMMIMHHCLLNIVCMFTKNQADTGNVRQSKFTLRQSNVRQSKFTLNLSA